MRADEAGAVLDDGTDTKKITEGWLAKGASLSGHEHNKTFMQRRVDGQVNYVDMSILSGLDSRSDGRSFAWIDIDKDGLRDVVVTNANEPRVQLFRNAMNVQNTVLAIRLVGAQRSSEPSTTGLSNRDGIGARIEVDAHGLTRAVELRAGEGLAAQNSSELLVGLGRAVSVDAVRVYWPGGRRSVLERVEITPRGRTALTIREDEATGAP